MEFLSEALHQSIFITGLVVMMMMMIESLNIESKGWFFSNLGKGRVGGVIVGAALGVIPGCMGGFATVSLYTHRMLSFGALVAMMIASCGDEAFVMMAMIPGDALWIFCLLFGIAVVTGLLTDVFVKKDEKMHCTENYEVHEEDRVEIHRDKWRLSWKRAVLAAATVGFIALLVLDNDEPDERWMHIAFAVLCTVVLGVILFGSNHFIEEHLWHHVIVKHLPGIFCWTFGVLAVLGLLMQYFDIQSWISGNTVLMILLATVIGIIPESGPHLVFVTLYASGIVPLPVLLASCISQDGHASLPLIAESKRSFLKAKLINCAAALVVGFAAMLFV
ncbi:MAG: putative manganese transporter [Bacteroidales bacterium]|nr:putative manganese transporter [Bacteroidales bacterium]